MELLTLKTFDTAPEAHLLKTKLSSEGILAFVFDENIVTLNPLYNIMIGGIKVMVSQSDFQRAQEIVSGIENTDFTDDDDNVIKCPACQSTRLYQGFISMKGFFGVLSIIISMILIVFPPYFRTVYKCKNCGTEFNNPVKK